MSPDKGGHFGIYGGRYAPETLMPALLELEKAYAIAKKDKTFQKELKASWPLVALHITWGWVPMRQ